MGFGASQLPQSIATTADNKQPGQLGFSGYGDNAMTAFAPHTMPAYSGMMPNLGNFFGPGYYHGGPQQPYQPQGQQNQQYFQDMHKSMDSMNQALQHIEQMQMPGGQYQGGGGGFGGGKGSFGGKFSPTASGPATMDFRTFNV